MLININEKHANAVIERINKGFPERTSVDINSVGMYTGLHDSKGNEIFEGDILKTALSEDLFGVVIWHPDGYFCMDTSFGQLPLRSYKPLGDVFRISKMVKDPKFEVIGNRTDNPELMERSTTALYCNGDDCADKENCQRYTKLMDIKKKDSEGKVFLTSKAECDNNREFFYIPIKKGGEK